MNQLQHSCWGRGWCQLARLNGAWPIQRSFTIIFQSASYQIREINAHLHQESGMLMHDVSALLPDRCTTLHAAKLSVQQGIEPVKVILGPANAGTAHYAGETLLVDGDGILDEIEVDEGNLEDVERQIAFEDAGSVEG